MRLIITLYFINFFLCSSFGQSVQRTDTGLLYLNSRNEKEVTLEPHFLKEYQGKDYSFGIDLLQKYGKLQLQEDEDKIYIFDNVITDQFFDILPEITVFDKSGMQMGKGYFDRLIYEKEAGFEGFMAVYTIDRQLPNDYYFYVSSYFDSFYQKKLTTDIHSEKYTALMQKYFEEEKIDLLYDYFAEDVIDYEGRVLIFCNTMNRYYILEYFKETSQLKKLYESEDKICFLRYYFLPVKGDYLLLDVCECETDILWTDFLELSVGKINVVE